MTTTSPLASRVASLLAMLALLSGSFGAAFPASAFAATNPTTDAATNITDSNATLNATNGDTDATGHSFWVSLNTIDTSNTTPPSGVYTTQDYGSVPANTAFSGALTDAQGMPAVTPSTTYHVVAWSNVGGTWNPGNEVTFTTLASGSSGNTAPVADNHSITMGQDTSRSFTLTASDVDGDTLTYATTSNPSNGTLTGTAPDLTYTPNAGYTGSDSFTFVANDGTSDSNTATVSITVNAAASPTPSNTTVVVKPSSMNGWYFYDDKTDSVLSDSADHGFVSGPGTPPEGSGSVHITKTNTDKYGIATAQFSGTALADISALSYSTYRASGTSAQAPSLGFDVDSDTTDGNTGYEGRLTYEPYFTQTVTTGSWQTWDTLADSGTGNWWFSHDPLHGGASQCTQANPCTWSELLAAYPHAAIAGQLIIRTNGADGEAFDGNTDGFRIATSSADTTYDFEQNAIPSCSTDDGSFDTFNLGSVNGQQGWSATGPYDQAIVENRYGYDLGCHVLRVSDAVTSGSFGDWIFAAPTADMTGEASATNGSAATTSLKSHFDMQFDIAAADTSAPSGAEVSVAPDRGDGSRMSYLRFEDDADGIEVYFDDVTDAGPVGTVATFNESKIATLDRTAPHHVELNLDAVDGPSNDVVTVTIDGTLVHTGTSWEDYYRYDPEASAEQSPRVVDTMIIQARGTAQPADQGYGFLFDNVDLSANDGDVTPPATNNGGGGHHSSFHGSGVAGFTGTVGGSVGGGQVLGAATYNFTVDLTIGSTGADVTALQQILIDAGFLHIAAPTGYFGPLTQAALAQWQAAHNIAPAVGYFGPITRAAMNAGTIETLTEAEKANILLQLQDILAQIKKIQDAINNLNDNAS